MYFIMFGISVKRFVKSLHCCASCQIFMFEYLQIVAMYKEFCSIAIQTDDFGCENGCTSIYIESCQVVTDDFESTQTRVDPSIQVKVEVNEEDSAAFSNELEILPQLAMESVAVKFEDNFDHFSNTNLCCTSNTLPEQNTEYAMVNVEHRFDYSVITESCDIPEGTDLIENESNMADACQANNSTQSNISETLKGNTDDDSNGDGKNIIDRSSKTQHSSSNGLKCSYCSKEFKYKFLLKEHMKKHTGQKHYECNYCKKRFPRKEAFKNHVRLHTGEKPFHCSCCDLKFSSYNNLFRHLRKQHPGQKNYACPHCDKKFSTKIEMNKHIHAEKHLDCAYCGQTFSLSFLLKQHLRKHTGEKPFSCHYCEKKFTFKKTLTEHLRIHTGVKVFECPYCKKKFPNKLSCDRHIRIHTGEKPHKCSYCSKTFAEPSNLTRHLVTHTGEKSVGCSQCGKKFARASYLKLHLRTHTGERPFQCSYCDLKFSGRSNMRRHISRIHGVKE